MDEIEDECNLNGLTYCLEEVEALFAKQQQEKAKSKSGAEGNHRDPRLHSQNPSTSAASEASGMSPELISLNTTFHDMPYTELTPSKAWAALQHYIYYFYRYVVSIKPYNNSDEIPIIISRAISEIFDNLLDRDTSQLCFKLVTLIREYVLVAKTHIDNSQATSVTTFLVTLMAYYSALCSSAGKFAPLLPEFDFLTLGRYNINWIGINKSIFYYHIYLSSNVQSKIPLFKKLKEDGSPSLKGLLETFVCFTQDMEALASKWDTLKMQITSTSKTRARSNPGKHLLKDWQMYTEHKKILNSPGWLNRTEEVINIQDMNELDGHILAWVADTTSIPESLIDDKGCCLCEDCLAAEFRNNTMASALAQSFRAESSAGCLVSCYVCNEPVVLENLLDHIVTEHTSISDEEELYRTLFKQQEDQCDDAATSRETALYEGLLERNAQIKRSLLELIDGTTPNRIKIPRDKSKKEHRKELKKEAQAKDKTSQTPNKLSDAFCGVVESEKAKPKSRSGETLFPFQQTAQSIFHSSEKLLHNSKDRLQNGEGLLLEAANSSDECKMFFEHMRRLVESTEAEAARNRDKQNSENLGKGTSTVSVTKDSAKIPVQTTTKIPNIASSKNENLPSGSATQSNSFLKPHQKIGSHFDSKVLEFLKNANANAQKTASLGSDSCQGHSCGHKCKHEDEINSMSCSEGCGHHKDPRKCDCAYCEGFPPSAPPKPSETRDRLRSRLNQRKEKANESMNGSLSKSAAVSSRPTTKGIDNSSIKILKNKVPLLNGKSINVTAKVDTSESTEPPRVPELNHPVPPPANSKTTAVVEVKKTECDENSPTNGTMASSTHTSSIPESLTDGASGYRSPSSMSTCSLFSESVDCRDINELLNYIEGTKSVDKVAIAHKKAAKKERQRSKKVQEKEDKDRIELEKLKLKEEARLKEEKLKEEEHRRAEAAAKLLAEKQKKAKKVEKVTPAPSRVPPQPKPEMNKTGKKKAVQTENVAKSTSNLSLKDSLVTEEKIPASVTIKRASEGRNSEAVVTITLKGSYPDTDKLLFTLVNGNEVNDTKAMLPIKANVNSSSPTKPAKQTKQTKPNSPRVVSETVKRNKKKKENTNPTKPIKVTLVGDKNGSVKKDAPAKKNLKMDTFVAHQLQQAFNLNKEAERSQSKSQKNTKEDPSLPLNLPPGITITKIDGPPSTGNCKYPNPITTPAVTCHPQNYSPNHGQNNVTANQNIVPNQTQNISNLVQNNIPNNVYNNMSNYVQSSTLHQVPHNMINHGQNNINHGQSNMLDNVQNSMPTHAPNMLNHGQNNMLNNGQGATMLNNCQTSILNNGGQNSMLSHAQNSMLSNGQNNMLNHVQNNMLICGLNNYAQLGQGNVTNNGQSNISNYAQNNMPNFGQNKNPIYVQNNIVNYSRNVSSPSQNGITNSNPSSISSHSQNFLNETNNFPNIVQNFSNHTQSFSNLGQNNIHNSPSYSQSNTQRALSYSPPNTQNYSQNNTLNYSLNNTQSYSPTNIQSSQSYSQNLSNHSQNISNHTQNILNQCQNNILNPCQGQGYSNVFNHNTSLIQNHVQSPIRIPSPNQIPLAMHNTIASPNLNSITSPTLSLFTNPNENYSPSYGQAYQIFSQTQQNYTQFPNNTQTQSCNQNNQNYNHNYNPNYNQQQTTSPSQTQNQQLSISNQYTPNPTKSGVIVVDTEKLIQQSIAASINKRDKKLNKKKRDTKPTPTTPEHIKTSAAAPAMITLKNPIFEAHQIARFPDTQSFDYQSIQQASIVKGENGMVTIRSPRLQNPFENGTPVSSYFSDAQPMYTSDSPSPFGPIQKPTSMLENSNNAQFTQYNSHYHAHEFLAGLPGIEITKINKGDDEYEAYQMPNPFQRPESFLQGPDNFIVNGSNMFNCATEEWYYETIFMQRGVLEDDMNDEELELEEFKRFCLQSFPLPVKDTNVNSVMAVRDYVYQNDVSYA